MTTSRWITLTTDFGLEDWFVGALKGVVASVAPQVKVVDLSHGVPPGDIMAGAFSLLSGYRFFPKETLHLVVVDPGVGGDRAPIVIRARDYLFMGPDNGVLSLAAGQEEVLEVRRLDNTSWLPMEISKTFHGRDVFAPAAARLAAGVPFSEAGPRLNGFKTLSLPQIIARDQCVEGAIIYVDRYGNGITNIPNQGFLKRDLAADVFLGTRRVTRVHECYQSVAPGKPVCVPGSSGYLEIAVNQGSASRQLKLTVGSPVAVRW